MSDLLVPGDDRAEETFSDAGLLLALARVEQAWLDALVGCGVAPADAAAQIVGLVSTDDSAGLARAAERGGNVVIPFVALLRERVPPITATWLHRGLTSQDVLDTAIVLVVRDALAKVADDLHAQVVALAGIAQRHRDSVQAARTLTQHAVPTTFGAVAAGWLDAVLNVAAEVEAIRLPVQVGGAGGTRSALAVLTDDVPRLVAAFAAGLDLAVAPPWHTNRRPLTKAADALVACTDAWGAIAAEILVRVRPEVAELNEPFEEGRGGSSTMAHKRNPVLSTLIHRTALSAPLHAAQLHIAAADTSDQRPAGAWHTEWPAWRSLARSAVAAGSLTSELLEGLEVDEEKMRATAEAAATELLTELGDVAKLVGAAGAGSVDAYLGSAGEIVDAAVARAEAWLGERA